MPEANGKNLASVIPLWDKLFGAYYNPGVFQKPMGGLKTGVPDRNPFLLCICPLQNWGRLLAEAWHKATARVLRPRVTPYGVFAFSCAARRASIAVSFASTSSR